VSDQPQTSQKTARAAVYTETGGPEVIRTIEKPVREPGPGEVRVRIHRSGINPTDWKSRQGSEPGIAVNPPHVPNHDGAGVVDAVGPGVEAALSGLRVWTVEAAHGRPEGTAQEYAILPVRNVVTLPDNASYDMGAALGVPFVTAHRCLTVTEEGPRRLGPGTLQDRVVLVAGGAGAVGNAAIQLARWSDATVIATVSSPEKGQLAAAAGADHVINYRETDVAAEIKRISPRGVDTIVEVAPADNAALDVEVIDNLGSIAVYANHGGDEFTLPVRRQMAKNVRWQFVLLYTLPPDAKGRAIDDIGAAILDNAIAVGEHAGLPMYHYSLDETAQAHAAVQDGAVGKVLIDVADG
jgi:NADPH:quinone reductase